MGSLNSAVPIESTGAFRLITRHIMASNGDDFPPVCRQRQFYDSDWG
jgi:hypothetical protein